MTLHMMSDQISINEKRERELQRERVLPKEKA